MCMFCAGVPTAVTLGLAAVTHQRTAQKMAEARGEAPAPPRFRAGPLTGLAVLVLAAGSVLFHLNAPQ